MLVDMFQEQVGKVVVKQLAKVLKDQLANVMKDQLAKVVKEKLVKLVILLQALVEIMEVSNDLKVDIYTHLAYY